MPLKDPEARKAYQRKWQKKKRAEAKKNGMCSTCRIKKPVSGYANCQKCRDSRIKTRNRYTKKYKEKYEKEGRCKCCGRPIFEEDRVRCVACRNSGAFRLWS